VPSRCFRPRPLDVVLEARPSGSIDQTAVDGEERGAGGPGHHQAVLRGELTEEGRPPDEVVGENSTDQDDVPTAVDFGDGPRLRGYAATSSVAAW